MKTKVQKLQVVSSSGAEQIALPERVEVALRELATAAKDCWPSRSALALPYSTS